MGSIGRNEPCPCGSGKKFKKCCLGGVPVLRDELPSQATQQADLSSPVEPIHALTQEELTDFIQSLVWTTPEYQEAATLLIDSMKESYEPQHIFEGLAFWNRYSKEAQPTFKKKELICAAVEYLIIEAHSFVRNKTELAEKYQVSVSSISRRYQEMIDYVSSNDYISPPSTAV